MSYWDPDGRLPIPLIDGTTTPGKAQSDRATEDVSGFDRAMGLFFLTELRACSEAEPLLSTPGRLPDACGEWTALPFGKRCTTPSSLVEQHADSTHSAGYLRIRHGRRRGHPQLRLRPHRVEHRRVASFWRHRSRL